MKKMWLYHSQQAMVYEIWKKMKLTIFLICISVFSSLAVDSYSQSTKLTLNLQDVTIKNVLLEIEENSEFRFFYSNNVDVERKVSINLRDKKVFDVLNELFKKENVKYNVIGRQIAIYGTQDKIESGLNLMQQKSISGKVSDGSGQPLPGVTVVVKGTTQGTVTDTNGNYILTNIPAKATLVFSFVGMKTQEVAVLGKQEINVVLEEETIGLEEVVAIGYGTQGKRNITGSISNLKTKGLEDLPNVSASEIIKGRIPGITISTPNGQPGQAQMVRIRGVSSVGAGDNPLVVVDGIPVGNNIPKSLNPIDIESFSVLKDASSTAIYGARGSNGVILITTKKGAYNTNELRFSTYVGLQDIPQRRRIEMLNAREYAQFMKETWTDNALAHGVTPNVPSIYQNPEQYGKGTDWYQHLLQNNPLLQNYNISYTGGTSKTRSMISGGYTNQDGLLLNTDFKRYSLRASVDADISSKIKIGLNISGSQTIQNNTDIMLLLALFTSPLQSPYNPDGTEKPYIYEDSPAYLHGPNYAYVLKNTTSVSTIFNGNASGYFEVELIKGLKYKAVLGVTTINLNYRYFRPSTIGAWRSPPPRQAISKYTTSFSNNWNFDNLLSYERKINDHSFKGLLGYTSQKYGSRTSAQKSQDFPNDEVQTIQSGATILQNSTGGTLWSLNGYFGRINYDYKGRYLVEATFRREGSSRFGSDNKWGNFPSFSVGWRPSDENFFPDIQNLDDFKIRASFGITGNNNIGDFTYMSNVVSSNYNFDGNFVAGKVLGGFNNSGLGWEKSDQFDIGFDMSLFDYRVQFNFDYYTKITKDMLYRVPIPAVAGFQTAIDNVGEVKNKGAEFSIDTKNLVGNFKWNTNFNFSYNTHKVVRLNTENDEIISGNNITRVGGEIGEFYGYKRIGIYNSQADLDKYPGWPGFTGLGAVIYEDVNKDGVISSLDKTAIGSPHPKFILGMTNTFSYKNFDLSVLLTSALGYQLFNPGNNFLLNLVNRFNVRKEVLYRWRSPENPGNGWVPTSTINVRSREMNSAWLENANHLWVKNITFGYNVPKHLLAQKGILVKEVRFFSSIQNAFLIAPGLSEGNPEASFFNGVNGNSLSLGQTWGATYPVPRIITFGLNITF